jgi:hypothetical protein
MLRCKLPFDLSFSLLIILLFLWYPLALVGTYLDFAAEDRRVTERNAALEKMSAGVENLWSDPRRGVLLYCFKIVLSTLAKQWMAAEDLSWLCTQLCFLAILYLRLSYLSLILF